jgi:hypothetical protein
MEDKETTLQGIIKEIPFRECTLEVKVFFERLLN